MLEIEAKLSRERAFVGESVVIEMLITNRGTAPIESPGWGDPVEVELRDSRGATRKLRHRPFRMSPVETPVAPPMIKTVYKPGERSRLFVDVAELAGETLAPGRYECAVTSCGSYSKWLSFTLESPRISAPSIHDGYAAWITDGTELFVRDQSPDPDRPAASRVLSGVADLRSVAVAELCFAVLTGDTLAIGLPGHRRLGGWLEGTTVGLAAPRLVEGRWVERDRTAFVIAGGTAARIATVRIERDSPQGSKLHDLELGPILDLSLPASTRTIAADGQLVAVWIDGSRVFARTLTPDGTTHTLLDRGVDVLAFNVGRKTVEVLLPGTQVHLRLDGTIQYEKPVPAAPAGATSWAIGAEPGAAVIARVANKIMAVRETAWSDGLTIDPGATRIALAGGHWPRYWAQWIDPACGLRHAPLD